MQNIRTEKESWGIFALLMVGMGQDVTVMQFPYILTRQISSNMDWPIKDVVFMFSASNLPNFILPLIYERFLENYTSHMLLILKFGQLISWFITQLAFITQSFNLILIGRTLQSICFQGILTINCYLFDQLFRPLGKTSYVYALRPIIDSIFISVAFKQIPQIYINHGSSIVYASYYMISLCVISCMSTLLYLLLLRYITEDSCKGKVLSEGSKDLDSCDRKIDIKYLELGENKQISGNSGIVDDDIINRMDIAPIVTKRHTDRTSINPEDDSPTKLPNGIKESRSISNLESVINLDILLVLLFSFSGTACTISFAHIGSSLLQGKYGFDLKKASNKISRLPLLASFAKIIVLVFVVKIGKRSQMMVLSSQVMLIVFISFLYIEDGNSYIQKLILVLQPISKGINGYIPMNCISLLSNKEIIPRRIVIYNCVMSFGQFFIPEIFGILVDDGTLENYDKAMKFFFGLAIFSFLLSVGIYVRDSRRDKVLDSVEQKRMN